MKLKKRKGKNYIVIGTMHLGYDIDVLKSIKTAADFFDADVVYAGPTADRFEVDMYRRRVAKLRTWEKHDVSKEKANATKLSDQLEELRHATTSVKTKYKGLSKKKADQKERERLKKVIQKNNDRIDHLKSEEALCWERMEDNRERLETECYELINAQRDRINTLFEIFGGKRVHVVSNPELMIPDKELFDDILGENFHHKQWQLSKHLFITSIPANGDKISGQPITQRTFRMLKDMGHSHIIPHMTPQTKPFPRPGLNQAFNYITTGAVQFCEKPDKISEAYKSSSKTSCILVSLDENNGEFHPQRLRIKKILDKAGRKIIPHIIHDGLVFDSSGNITELKTADKANSYTDAHAPHTHEGVIGAIRALNVLHVPSVLVDGGDMGNMESVSRFTKNKPGDRENLRLINDLMAVRKLWDAVGDPEEFPSIKEKVAVGSNHMDWITLLVAENPNLKELLDIATLAKTYFPDWNMLLRETSDEQGYVFGDLNIKHGDDEGTIMVAGDIYGNYLGGHDHSFQEFLDAIKSGTACRVDHRIHKYLRNKATSWQNAVTTISKFRGVTCKHPKIILHTEDTKKSRFSYRGEIFEVDFYFI